MANGTKDTGSTSKKCCAECGYGPEHRDNLMCGMCAEHYANRTTRKELKEAVKYWHDRVVEHTCPPCTKLHFPDVMIDYLDGPLHTYLDWEKVMKACFRITRHDLKS